MKEVFLHKEKRYGWSGTYTVKTRVLSKTVEKCRTSIRRQLASGQKIIRVNYVGYLFEPILKSIASERLEVIWLTHIALCCIPKDIRKLIIRRVIFKLPSFKYICTPYEYERKHGDSSEFYRCQSVRVVAVEITAVE
jgi:hypothetical protein